MSSSVDLVMARLEQKGFLGRKQGSNWIAQCPSHPDRTPSLSISEGNDGNALMICHAGCDYKSVLDALDLKPADLFPKPLPKPTKPSLRPADKKMVETIEYIYPDENADTLFHVVRTNYSDGSKDFRQGGYIGDGHYEKNMDGVRRVLYNLPRIGEALLNGDPIYIVEGEKDADTLTNLGHFATCNPGGADSGKGSKWTPEMTASLDAAHHINIIIDNDQPGETHGRYVFNELKTAGVEVEIYRPTLGKDITERIDKGGTLNDCELLDSTLEPTGWADKPTKIDETELSGWLPRDLGPILSGDFKPSVPTIFTTNTGKPLFYAGKVNALWGASDSGKTMIVMLALAQEIRLGHHVAYLDFEDKAERFVELLQMHGLSNAQILEYAHYVSPEISGDSIFVATLVDLLEGWHCTLVGIDSVGEALALDAINQNDDGPVALWHRDLPRKLSANGICVVLVDHITKNKDDDGYNPIGTQRKKAAIDGIAYKVKAVEPFSKEKSGKISLNVAKDRPGTYAKRSTVASAVVTIEEGFSIVLYDPDDPMPGRSYELLDRQMIEIVSDWIWDERDKIFSGWICRDHIETLKLRAPTITHRSLQEAVKVLRSSEYSTPEGRQYRLEKRFVAETLSTDLHATTTEPISISHHTTTDHHARTMPTVTPPPRAQGDQSEPTTTDERTPLKGCALVVVSDDTRNGLHKDDPFPGITIFKEPELSAHRDPA